MICWPGYHHGKKPNSGRGLRVGNPLARNLRFFFPLGEGTGNIVNSITPNGVCGLMGSQSGFTMAWDQRGVKQVHGTGAASSLAGIRFGQYVGGSLVTTAGQTLGAAPCTFMFKIRIDALNTTPNFFCSGGFSNSSSQLGLTTGGLPRIHFGGVDTYAPGSGPAVPTGSFFTLTYTISNSPSQARVYFDDYLAYSSALAFAMSSASFFNYGQGGQTGSPPAQAIDGITEYYAYWDRVLSPADVAQMVADPYQIVRAPAVQTYWTPTDYPAPPTLSSTTTATTIALNWTAVSGATGYNVYRASFSGNETYLTTVGAVTTYTDTGLTLGSTWYYRVSANTSKGEGILSNEIVATANNSRAAASMLMFFE